MACAALFLAEKTLFEILRRDAIEPSLSPFFLLSRIQRTRKALNLAISPFRRIPATEKREARSRPLFSPPFPSHVVELGAVHSHRSEKECRKASLSLFFFLSSKSQHELGARFRATPKLEEPVRFFPPPFPLSAQGFNQLVCRYLRTAAFPFFFPFGVMGEHI